MAADDQRIVAAIVVAAGWGERLGSGGPKAFVAVAGRTLLEHATEPFRTHRRVRDVILVAPANLTASAAELVPSATVVPGGRTRQESVARGLAALADDVELVLVHDVARAFVPPAVLDRVLQALDAGAAAVVPVVPVTDTIRAYSAGTNELGATVDRSSLRAVQTPQGFSRATLDAAHAGADPDATDDASLVEAIGGQVVAVRGAEEAFKVTVPLDLARAEAVAARG
ncbi:MAG: 2-C-methyl-D-erythritol 4-phosphate cytidylyltransferase [Jatrophihabitantaceae bacterium]